MTGLAPAKRTFYSLLLLPHCCPTNIEYHSVCLFAADLTKFTSTNKVKYPLKNRQNKNIQWQFSYPEKVPAGKFSKAFFTEMKMNPEDTIRLSKWDRGIQMMIPDSKVGTANPLGITIVECAPYEEMEKLENKGVVINMKAFPGLHKGWFEGETPPPLEEEACELVKRDGKGKGKNGKKGSKSCKKKGKKTKKTKKAKKTKKTKKAKKTKKTKHTKTKKAKKHTRRPKKTAGRGGRRGGRRN